MSESTSINESGVKMSTRNDETVKGLYFAGNTKILHLPDNVAESFPNLEGYFASRCSLKEITKRNFNGLVKLRGLFLHHNEIEKIEDDTFEGLLALESLYLGKKNLISVQRFLILHSQNPTKSSS